MDSRGAGSMTFWFLLLLLSSCAVLGLIFMVCAIFAKEGNGAFSGYLFSSSFFAGHCFAPHQRMHEYKTRRLAGFILGKEQMGYFIERGRDWNVCVSISTER